MAHGGARPNSGPKLGSTQKIPRAKVAELIGQDILDLWVKMIRSKNKLDQKWAAHEAAPFAFQKLPQAVELSGADGADIVQKIDVTIHNAT
jgi:hypothetical protein